MYDLKFTPNRITNRLMVKSKLLPRFDRQERSAALRKAKKTRQRYYRFVAEKKKTISDDEVIELAWCDKTSFNDIFFSTGLKEPEVIKLMRKNMKPGSFRLWRKRVSGRASKHRSRISDW